MQKRLSEYDVACTVNVTEPASVCTEVCGIYSALYDKAPVDRIQQAFRDFESLYTGSYPGYHACDTIYHDIQHSLDATLAMARLMDGYERSNEDGRNRLGAQRFALGAVIGLFHDAGYVRKRNDRTRRNGAEYTAQHVGRSAAFLKTYLPGIGLRAQAATAAQIVHFTGYEIPLDRLTVPSPKDRLLGAMLGTADLISQMADRCYLEKCRDRLYPEFLLAGIARRRNADGSETVIYSSAEHLLLQTPAFYLKVRERLELQFGGVYRYAAVHFGGRNRYLEEMDNNFRYLEHLIATGNLLRLRRQPLQTPQLRDFPFPVQKTATAVF